MRVVTLSFEVTVDGRLMGSIEFDMDRDSGEVLSAFVFGNAWIGEARELAIQFVGSERIAQRFDDRYGIPEASA